MAPLEGGDGSTSNQGGLWSLLFYKHNNTNKIVLVKEEKFGREYVYSCNVCVHIGPAFQLLSK